MSTLLSFLCLLLLFSCSSETTTPTTSFSSETTSVVKSNFTQLDEATFSIPLEESHQIKFLDYIQPKQMTFNNNNKGMGSRSDTLYHISYLPFKDQELYLYRTFLDHSRGSSLLWNIAILKNGMIQVDEQLISYEEEPIMKFTAMNISGQQLLFEGTKADGSIIPLELPYDGKTVLNLEK